MLTQQFVASVGVPTQPLPANLPKDAAISIHEHQPLSAQRAVFKKSATPPNCLAVTRSHIFAAQADKAVVNVYSRVKNNQEATVPFPERITCITLACEDTVLILGTAEGRLFLWETASGRQVTTSQSHLQPVWSLAVDPTSNFLLSASADSTVHVWSIPLLLSFANAGVHPLTPLRTFASHKSEVTSLVLGHSSSSCNIAITASKDRTCLIWDYHTNSVLRTYLLPAVPRSLALDAAERAAYVGYEDGSIQQLDLFASVVGQKTSLANVGSNKEASGPVQPGDSSKWTGPGKSAGAVLSVSISFDGCAVLSGHESGVINIWDAAKGGFSASLQHGPLPGPVNNLSFLPVSGFKNGGPRNFKLLSVVKPKFGAFDSPNGGMPGSYSLNLELAKDDTEPVSDFEAALEAPSFPQYLIDEGLGELSAWGSQGGRANGQGAADGGEDCMALDDPEKSREDVLTGQNASLKAELDALRRLQKASFQKIDKINAEKKALVQREQNRTMKSHNADGRANGMNHADEVMSSSSDED